MCDLAWILRFSALLKLLLHWKHWWGFSFVWVLTWTSILYLKNKKLLIHRISADWFFVECLWFLAANFISITSRIYLTYYSLYLFSYFYITLPSIKSSVSSAASIPAAVEQTTRTRIWMKSGHMSRQIIEVGKGFATIRPFAFNVTRRFSLWNDRIRNQ